MATAYVLSRTLIPACSAAWLPASKHGEARDGEFEERKGVARRAFAKWRHWIERCIDRYLRALDWVLAHCRTTAVAAFALLLVVVGALALPLRREFFPIVDGGAFEMYVRAPSGTRLEITNERIAEVEDFIRSAIPKDDLRLIVAQIGLTPDWSAAYTRNTGKMDATLRIQLTEDRRGTAQQYVRRLREALAGDWRFADLEFAFNSGGLIRGALNEGKVTPINIRVTGKKHEAAHEIADLIRRKAAAIDGVVDARVMQRQDYPQFSIEVDRAKAADLGLTQEDVMKSVIAAMNSSILFNKNIFWIDGVSGNQYFVGVQYPLAKIESLETLLDVPVTGLNQSRMNRRIATTDMPDLMAPDSADRRRIPVPPTLSNLVRIRRGTVATEISHINIRPTIDVSLNVEGRDLGHVADDVHALLDQFGEHAGEAAGKSEQLGTTWRAYDPEAKGKQLLEGTDIVLSGEYSRMKQTFRNLAIGLALAVILIYFMMVALEKSFRAPLCVLLAAPLILVGVLPMLYFTKTSINVQSLLGVIFAVGISVANTVLLTDVAQEFGKSERLSPRDAIRKAAAIRVRPVTMTALAAFFAMIPTALALEKGSEANAPLGRAILGGLLAAEPATLFVVPALYSLIAGRSRGRDAPNDNLQAKANEAEVPAER
jgi:multidrug efflux pump subunit AcrB